MERYVLLKNLEYGNVSEWKSEKHKQSTLNANFLKSKVRDFTYRRVQEVITDFDHELYNEATEENSCIVTASDIILDKLHKLDEEKNTALDIVMRCDRKLKRSFNGLYSWNSYTIATVGALCAVVGATAWNTTAFILPISVTCTILCGITLTLQLIMPIIQDRKYKTMKKANIKTVDETRKKIQIAKKNISKLLELKQLTTEIGSLARLIIANKGNGIIVDPDFLLGEPLCKLGWLCDFQRNWTSAPASSKLQHPKRKPLTSVSEHSANYDRTPDARPFLRELPASVTRMSHPPPVTRIEPTKERRTEGVLEREMSPAEHSSINTILQKYRKLPTESEDILEIIKEAGREILKKYCSGEPTFRPTMFPPAPQQKFIDVFTDCDLEKKRNLQEKDKQEQCDAEIEVYRVLESVHINDNDFKFANRIVVLSGLKYTHQQYERIVGDHDCKVKNPHDEEGECDFLLLCGNIVCILEVKAPQLNGKNDCKIFDRNVSDSLKQRHRTRLLVESISKLAQLESDDPIEIYERTIFNRIDRVTVESFDSKYKEDESLLFSDDMEKIKIKIRELRNLINIKNGNIIDDAESLLRHLKIVPASALIEAVLNFPRFYSILLGLWCVDKNNGYNTDICSLGYWTKKIDLSLRNSVITRNPKCPISSNVKGGPDIFKKYLDITCITEPQKDIFNEKTNCLFINGPAGSGKTILILGKVLQLIIKNKTARKIVLVVPGETIAANYKQILDKALGSDSVRILRLPELTDKKNKGQEKLTEKLFKQILELQQKIVVVWKTIQYYNSSMNYNMNTLIQKLVDTNSCHIFIDDIQDVIHAHIMPSAIGQTPFLDVVSYAFEKLLSTAPDDSPRVMWVVCDLIQDFATAYQLDGDRPVDFRGMPAKSMKYLSVNLRNSADISNALGVIRKVVITEKQIGTSPESYNDIVPLQKPGHYIHGPIPSLNILLTESARNLKTVEKWQLTEISNIINCELDRLLVTSKDLAYNDVAVVVARDHEKTYSTDRVMKLISDVLRNRAESSNDTRVVSDITVCDIKDCSSLEMPAVIGILETAGDQTAKRLFADFFSNLYKVMARARVYSSVIVTGGEYGLDTDHYKQLFKELEPFVATTYRVLGADHNTYYFGPRSSWEWIYSKKDFSEYRSTGRY